jgi:ribonuclease E
VNTEGSDNAATTGDAVTPAAVAAEAAASVAAVAPAASLSDVAEAAHAPAQVAEAAAPAPAPAPAQAVVVEAAPTVAAPVAAAASATFVLSTTDLQAIAQSAGLEWVGSDTEKVRAAQEAMAREPKPAHVPREIKPVVLADEGPLVLVETRKDLSQIKLPFENAQQG